jgi:nucleoside-diphosphate-sugar epimerase
LGVNLLASLKDDGVEVVNVDLAPPRLDEQRDTWRQVNILDVDALRDVMVELGPDAVVHLAARTDLDGRSPRDYLANTDGTRNVIDVANAVGGVERLVIASSRLVFDTGFRPQHDFDYHASTQYGRSKIEVERISLAEGPERVPCIVVRPTSIWGPWFDVPYRNFFLAVARGAYVHPRGRRIYKSMGYVGNVIHQLKQIASAPTDQVAGRVFYLADYEPLEVSAWAERIAAACAAPPIREVPIALLHLMAAVGSASSALGLPAPLTRFRLKNLMADVTFDLGATRDLAGECPFTEAEGIDRTVAWLRATGSIRDFHSSSRRS